ncbi:MAG: glutamine amidotransferase [Candidatus Rokubacteria bacterium RIFCSPLOWO2_02_FULL_73_56]|nr:MAG: glutamine amidotransferase [Candidatus Rokubacteria bacterium RIFCSPHIGHO2_02_FULL_73_26]OGL10142.1 MAG: glutamine amidotransferase [Candidatus Rokubacteria bacterium RIFCSPLOWO2_02_FULL_73_56]OGL29929.1 MAG: glutamine amidotransferase [Candidatus Rokubacteria bacterium RIFCSPLOWO2_12_FULL_73_47]
MQTALAIRHVAFEDLGTLGEVLARRGVAVAYAEAPLDDLAALDPLAPDLLVVLGGPIGAYEEEAYPVVRDELRLLDKRLAAGRPTLGICLGSQLMARALGARVHPGARKEIGWAPLELTAAGARSCLAELGGAPVLHWHGDTFELPDGAVRLASTAPCANQAFAWGRCALGLQFHVEVTARGLERWLVGHACEIAATPGVTVAGLRADTARWGPALEQAGHRVLARWLDEAEAA